MKYAKLISASSLQEDVMIHLMPQTSKHRSVFKKGTLTRFIIGFRLFAGVTVIPHYPEVGVFYLLHASLKIVAT